MTNIFGCLLQEATLELSVLASKSDLLLIFDCKREYGI